MSTVVVVKKGGTVAIAADTLTSFGSLKLAAGHNAGAGKIVQVGESYLGIVGSAAHKHVVRHAFSALEVAPQLSSTAKIFDVFRTLHPRLKQEYFLNPTDEGRDPYESSQMVVLIANRHGIFGVYSLREVFEHDRFWAVGSGSDYALGAMHAVYDSGVDARRIAETGVRAAIEFDAATGLPITSHVVSLDGTEPILANREVLIGD